MVWEQVGQRIKSLRCKRHLTQAQFANLIGVSSQYVGRIERGARFSGDLIAHICKKTGVTADYLMFGNVDPLTDMARLRELSPEQIDIGFDILKKLADLINTDFGNELLIKEVMMRQS